MPLPELLDIVLYEEILIEAPRWDRWPGQSFWFTWLPPLETDSVDLRLWVREAPPVYAVMEHSLQQTLLETDDLDQALTVFRVNARHVEEAREVVVG